MTARARILAAFGAYLCLTAHLVGVVHVLVVRHATCPDHGEVVHGEAPALVEAPPPLGPTARAAAREEAEEADEHCLLMATRRRELAGLAPAATPALSAPLVTRLDSPPAVVTATPHAILRLAPKTSPPAAV
jgi:hypothetical protein